jgi:hypothetical protein
MFEVGCPEAAISFIYLYTIFPRDAIPQAAGKDGMIKRFTKLLILALSIEMKAFDFKKES